jgi:hypothetical protein
VKALTKWKEVFFLAKEYHQLIMKIGIKKESRGKKEYLKIASSKFGILWIKTLFSDQVLTILLFNGRMEQKNNI